MSDKQFDIIFRGDIVFGHQLSDVKAKLQNLFKADAAKIDALFSGRPVPLKRGLDEVSAQKYKEALIKAGAQVDIVVVSDIKSEPIVKSVAPVEPVLSLAQRLAQQAEADKEAAGKAARQQEQTAQEAVSRAPTNKDQLSWSLAPLGSDLLQQTEKVFVEPISVDTSAISLRPEGGNILDVSEQAPAPRAQVIAPNFEIAAVGVDLISADEKMELPLLELELSDWTLADLGNDLISQSEKPPVATQTIQTLDVGLAPVGTDLGQLKPQIKVVIPDISGIRLAD